MTKKKGKKGFFQETPFQLILLIVTFVALALLISRIFAGAAIGDKMCQIIPWLCGGSSSTQDYEVSKRSAEAVYCAVGSAITGTLWPGASGSDCKEFYSQTASSSSKNAGTGGIISTTGAATGDEKLTVSQLRELKPTVTCDTQKKTCTVKNFVMPQEVTNAEEWIAFWGDPHDIIYWDSFPLEEDTWNFQINWVHHAIIAGLAILPVGKSVGLGFKTILTSISGPGKKLIAKQAAKTLLKDSEETLIKDALLTSKSYWVGKGAKEITDAEIAKVISLSNVLKAGGLSPEAEAALIKESSGTLSKLTKSELKKLFESAELKYGRGQALKQILTEDTVAMLSQRIKKVATSGKELLVLGGKVGTGEVALHALAYSTMKKYDQQGNAIAIKNPGIDKGDMKTFELPAEMVKKPFLVKWKPESGNIEMKNAHLVSPCYLKEFTVSYVPDIKCDNYIYNEKYKNTTCINQNGETMPDAPIQCGKFDGTIDAKTVPGAYETTNSLLKMSNKKLFEIDDSWKLKKIYVPWFISDDGRSPKYYIGKINFMQEKFKYSTDEKSPNQEGDTADVQIGQKLDFKRFAMSNDYKESYKAFLTCDNCIAFNNVDDEKDSIMSYGKQYILNVYYIKDSTLAVNDVAVDVYDIEKCTNLINIQQEKYDAVWPCEQIKNVKFPSGSTPRTETTLDGAIRYYYTVTSKTLEEQMNEIKTIISDVKQKGKAARYLVKIIPEGALKPENLDVLGGITDCGNSIDSRNCFRTFSSSGISATMECKQVSPFPEAENSGGGAHIEEACDITFAPEISEIKSLHLTRIISFDDAPLSTDRYNVYDITYSSLSIEPTDGQRTKFYFTDNDENGEWDDLSIVKEPSAVSSLLPDCIFGSDKENFKIKFSDIQADGKYNIIGSENCKTAGVVLSFPNDRPSESKIKTDSNYCIRETTGVTRALTTNLFCGITPKGIISTALGLAAMYFGDGVGYALLAGSAVSEVGPDVSEEYQNKWP